MVDKTLTGTIWCIKIIQICSRLYIGSVDAFRCRLHLNMKEPVPKGNDMAHNSDG